MKAIYIEGFKPFFERQRIALADVTIFAGANSSGKSSAMQPLLLMKQTIESQYDPGALLLAGPNIKFTSLDQMLSKRAGENQKSHFSVTIESDSGMSLSVSYARKAIYEISVKTASVESPRMPPAISFHEGRRFTSDEDAQLLSLFPASKAIYDQVAENKNFKVFWEAVPARCFPDIRLIGDFGGERAAVSRPSIEFNRVTFQRDIRKDISDLIHIQGLRGNPERTYSSTARVAKNFPGVFTDYVASVLQRWQEASDSKLDQLGSDLRRLGLSWKVRTKAVHDTQVEIAVSRLPNSTQGGAHDLVNLADVGLGVSQILPFLVALRAAKRNQVVFVEQPEIHLHPRAQYELADIILEAINRGVRVWLETHSSSLLRAFQTKVAEGSLKPESLALNWFSRDVSTGATRVATANIGPLGQYGDWPVDFDDVSLNIEKAFLDVVAKKSFGKE